MSLRPVMRQLRFSIWLAVVAVLATRAGAATNVVTTLADDGPGSLRAAILSALNGDTIVVATNGTISLTNGELVIAKSLNMVGPGAPNLAISGRFMNRVLTVPAGVTGTIIGITICNGRTSNGFQTGVSGENGGGISNAGTLTLIECDLLGNRTGNGSNGVAGLNGGPSVNGTGGTAGGSGGAGGAIYNRGQLTLRMCKVVSNHTGDGGIGGTGGTGGSGGVATSGGNGGLGGKGGFGGAIFNSGDLAIVQTVLADNTTGNGGGASNGGGAGFGSGCGPFCYGFVGNGGGGGPGGYGGALWNEGTLTVVLSVLKSNSCGRGGAMSSQSFWVGVGSSGGGGNGGALGNSGNAFLNDCTFTDNAGGTGGIGLADNSWAGSGGAGGAVFNRSNLTAINCTFNRNSGGRAGSSSITNPTPAHVDGGWGGAIANGSGGAVANVSMLLLSNCTISGNSAGVGFRLGFGGGVCSFYDATSTTIATCTISSNAADQGGGIFIQQDSSAYTNSASLHNSVIVHNRTNSPADVLGKFISRGYNLIGDGCCLTNSATGDLIGTTNSPLNPLLGPLANNGGPTPTHALLPGSPAIDAGDDSLTGTDQRGRPRKSGAHVDIGAFEFQVPTPQSLSAPRRTTNGAFQFTFTNLSDATLNVLASTNVSLASTQWLNLGPATLITNGLYQFTDPAMTSNRQRFFQLRWP